MAEFDIFSNIIHTASDGIDIAGGDTLYLGAGVVIAGEGNHYGIASTDTALVDIAGTVFGGGSGINLAGNFCNLAIEASGAVSEGSLGGTAILLQGAVGTVVNDGSVSGGTGIEVLGGQSSVTNNGTISTARNVTAGLGIYAASGSNFVMNTGTITAGYAAIEIGDDVGGTAANANHIFNTGQMTTNGSGVNFINHAGNFDTFDNSGSVVVTGAAVLSSGGALAVTNSGSLIGGGTISFSAGAGASDTLSNSGSITGKTFAVMENGAGSLSVANTGQIEGVVQFNGSTGDTLENSGKIHAGTQAIVENGTSTLSVENDGRISSAQFAVTFHGASGTDTLVNHGIIHSDSAAVFEGGTAELEVVNTGKIVGQVGIAFETTQGRDTVENTGFIHATGDTSTAIEAIGGAAMDITNDGRISGNTAILFASATDVNTLENTGTITSTTSGGYAIYSSGGAIDITNAGHIHGAVFLDEANDIYDGALGTVSGIVSGNGGSDTLIGGAGDETFLGGAGKDVLKGGAGDDVLTGGTSADTLNGGSGDNIFVYLGVADSTGSSYDKIRGFDASHDKFDFDVSVTGIDAAVVTGSLSASTFSANVTSAIGAGHLAAHHAVLFTASAGTLAGHTYLIVDANGTAGYQATHDYVIDISHAASLTGLGIDNFI